MKKLIAVTIVALMMFAVGASSFALVVDTPAGYKNPPVFISGISVSDAWMSGLTVQNWQGSLTNQAYAEGSYIWFIAKISVSAYGDTDAAHMWDGVGDDEAKLTLTGKDGCLNFASANMATLAKINGMNVVARQISSTNTNVVDATEGRAIFKFNSQQPSSMDSNGTLGFYDDSLNLLTLDAVYDGDTFIGSNNATLYAPTGGFDGTTSYNSPQSVLAYYNGSSASGDYRLSKSTNQKDYYLHFMAITKSATEGVCSGTLTVNGDSEFDRDTKGIYVASGSNVYQTSPDASYTSSTWWNNYINVGQYNTGNISDTTLKPGDRSELYLLYNTVNGKTYSIGKIHGKATDTAMQYNMYGPYANDGSIYILMDKEADDFVIGFAVSGGKFQGLVTWDDDRFDKMTASTGLGVQDSAYTQTGYANVTLGKADDFNYISNPHTWNAAYYIPLMSNDYSNNLVALSSAYASISVGTSELQAIFDFFGFAYVNPKAPTDADFLSRTGLVTTAEAKYNVANAVVTTPDTSVVIPKTGDAATSTGLILVASAILAAAAVGFVLSKRAYN